ncbi:PBP1A family penicillin-binding protein [Paenibacillus pinistramenti]|uniref:PBP1A family penicillin-binding protein n=1 Tax=Paenibacillus pinistramenti TaxID=1768003 RepID=UPI001109ECB0|nr:PBP1A family penicillin-binding protein [Paenibacillus pinistramenti]
MPTDRPSRMERNHKKPDKMSEKPKGKKNKKRLNGRMIFWTSFFTVAIAVICGIVGYLFITVNGEKLLDANKDKLQINGPTQVFDRSGKLMGEMSLETSDPVDSEDIPKLVKEAFVATEDRRFYEHSGVDFWSIGRAAVKDIVARSMVEGGSTITQQLAKNIFLTRDKTFFRKATEMSIAMALERQYTKDEILTMYLNRINFGGTTYGIKAASEKYFGISDLNKLDVWQIATLAAMPKGPSAYNPLRHPEASTARRAVVLDLMYDQGYITAEQRDEAKAVVYDYQPPASKQNYLAFIDYVMDEAEDVMPDLTEDDLVRGGYKIYTTMDAQAQKAVEKAFADDDNFEESVDDQPVQAAMIIMNHENGGIVALLGGREYERKGFSRITSRRQPGSAFKPIVAYAPALDTGKFNVNSELSNEKQCFNDYCPTNLHGYSNTIGMTEAITKSENIPAVWLLNQIGVKTGISYAEKMGVQLDSSDNNLAIALGGLTKGTTVKEMAEAYSVFANDGKYNEAYSIKQIVDPEGTTVYKHGNPEQEQVLSEDTAYYMTEMMQNVVTEGTGKNASLGERPIAGKTGTTQSGISGSSKNRDAWFVGYTPEYTAAVWMGYDKPDKDHLLNGSSGESAKLFSAVMKEALKDVPITDFEKPSDLSEPTAPPPSESAPQGVTGLSGSFDNSTATVKLSWNAPDQADGGEYRIYRKASDEQDFSMLMSVLTTDAEDLSVAPGKTYQYYVTYYDKEKGQESDPSGKVEVDVPEEQTPASEEPSPDVSAPEESPPPEESAGDMLSAPPGETTAPESSDTGEGNNEDNSGDEGTQASEQPGSSGAASTENGQGKHASGTASEDPGVPVGASGTELPTAP